VGDVTSKSNRFAAAAPMRGRSPGRRSVEIEDRDARSLLAETLLMACPMPEPPP